MLFSHKNFEIPCRGSKVIISQQNPKFTPGREFGLSRIDFIACQFLVPSISIKHDILLSCPHIANCDLEGNNFSALLFNFRQCEQYTCYKFLRNLADRDHLVPRANKAFHCCSIYVPNYVLQIKYRGFSYNAVLL